MKNLPASPSSARAALMGAIAGMANAQTRPMDDIAARLVRFGYAKLTKPAPASPAPRGVHQRPAPKGKVRLTPAGEQIAARLQRGAKYVYLPHVTGKVLTDAEAALWTAMRIRLTFTFNDLASLLVEADLKQAAQVAKVEALRRYFALCARRGLLSRLRNIAGQGSIYRLAHNLGPIPPVFRGSATWDGNARAFWWAINESQGGAQ